MAGRKRQDNRRTYRFTGLLLENWRNFVSADVELQQRTFLVGPNASGKSNLLDAFRFLYDIAAVGGGFQEAVRRRGGVSGMRALSARRYPDVGIRVTVGNDEEGARWEYNSGLLRTTSAARSSNRRPSYTTARSSPRGQTRRTRPTLKESRRRTWSR